MDKHFVVKPMSVDLISITPPEEVVRIWVNSRPELLSLVDLPPEFANVLSQRDGKDYSRTCVFDSTSRKYTPVNEYLEELIDMNLSNLYFANVTCNVHSSLLTREFFYHFDSYLAQWAKTNRNGINKDELVASEECYSSKDDTFYNDMYKYLEDFENGVGTKNFDEVKQNLPLSYQTTWQFSMPVKLLMRIIGYAFYTFGRCKFTQSLWLAFNEVPELSPYMGLVGRYVDYCDPMFPTYKASNACEFEDSITISKTIGLTVFSHLIRHEGLRIGGFLKFMDRWLNGNLSRSGKDLTFKCSITTSKQRWKEIIKLRTSWFAMTDDWDSPNSWGVFLKDYITGDLEKDKPYLKYFDLAGNFLPSEVKAYEAETSIRVRKGNKTQLPDAFLLESKRIVLDRILNVGYNPLLFDYLKMFDNGYVKDNPENEMRKLWESYENIDTDTSK